MLWILYTPTALESNDDLAVCRPPAAPASVHRASAATGRTGADRRQNLKTVWPCEVPENFLSARRIFWRKIASGRII